MELDKDEVSIHVDKNGGQIETGKTENSGNGTEEIGDDQTITWKIEDKPPVALCLFLGFQHYLTMLGSTLAIPFALSKHLCVDIVAITQIVGTIFVVSGIATFSQATFGVRLPIIQGGTFAFLAPVIALLDQPRFACEPASGNSSGPVDNSEIWQRNMREVQGAIMVASLAQVFIGLTGIVGWMLQFVGPLCIAPTITLVGLALFEEAAYFAAQSWPIAIMTVVLIALFSQYLINIHIPIPGSGHRLPIFKLFPVILAVITSWLICVVLTFSGVFSDDPKDSSYTLRVDAKAKVITDSPWIRIPYPFQWGVPTVSMAAVFGLLAGVLASMLESVGDYYACARLAGAKPPALHAINRGIFVEGVCCVMAGMFGTGNGTTSYSENVGAIGITKVGSRRVVQYSALMMVTVGCFAKFGAIFATIPAPIIGGVFICMFAMISGTGLSNLQFVDMSSTRNMFVLGMALFIGITVPKWMQKSHNHLNLGVAELDQIIEVLLSTSMFVGGTVGFILDNSIPGTKKQRGLLPTNANSSDAELDAEGKRVKSTYDIPIIHKYLEKVPIMSYFPISSTFGMSRKREAKSPSTKDSGIGNSEF